MVTKVNTGAITGIDCRIVCVEVDVSTGLPQLEMVGRLSAEVREAEKRVRVALKNTGISLPPQRITALRPVWFSALFPSDNAPPVIKVCPRVFTGSSSVCPAACE